ncbi:unnamed protein product [Moneuplotes crassus]|uniref:AAA+ ATPase domain-containing protein n=1 Tax=Euplotes crassus TaxID=5936 RepID=A0AAD1X597_EUPCR|nr:unnamed protein product [Moneuplotes crassus]
MGKKKGKNKAKNQPEIVDEGIIYPAQRVMLQIENSNSYGLSIDNNMIFNTYIKNTLINLKFLKINQTIKICVYGENLPCKVIRAESKIPILTEEELAEKLKSEETEESKEDISAEMEEKLTLEESKQELPHLYCVEKDTKIKLYIEQDDEDETVSVKEMIELTQKYKLDFDGQQPIVLGEIEDKFNCLQELIKLRKKVSCKSKESFRQVQAYNLDGPSGTGKTTFMQMVSQRIEYPIFGLTATQMGMNKADEIKDLFTIAKNSSPSIIFIDEIDGISDEKNDETAILLTKLIDRIKWVDKILIVAATNNPSSVNKFFKRTGRLDSEIKFDAPTSEGRYEIFRQYFDKCQSDLSEEEVKSLAIASSGFVGSDIASSIRDAYIRAMRRIDPLSMELPKIQKIDIEGAILDAKPSNIKDLIATVPQVYWEDIGGNAKIKKQLIECVEWPLKYPESFKRIGIKAPQGILLYGPPGCSKTLMAKALATESKLNFISIKGPELFSKYVGDTEKAIREIFRKARISSPCIIFFDEIDAMASARGDDDTSVGDRALCQLLTEMDGIEEKSQVIVIAATNRLDILDKAILRPGRFDRHIEIPFPDDEGKLEILEIGCRDMPLAEDVDLTAIAKRTTFFSGADIALVCREAGLLAIREDIETKEVKMCHFEEALQSVKTRKR